MLHVKIFADSAQGGDVSRLEEVVDRWLESTQPAIRRVMQSSSPGLVVLTFLYDDSRRDTRTPMASAVMPEAFAHGSNDPDFDTIDDAPDVLPEAELPY